MFDPKMELGIGGTLVLLFVASVYYDVAGGIILSATLLIPCIAFKIFTTNGNPYSVLALTAGSIIAWLLIAAWACRRSILDGVGGIVDSSAKALDDFFKSVYGFLVDWGTAIFISAVAFFFLIGLSVWAHNRLVERRYKKRAEQKRNEITERQWMEDHWRRKL